VEVKVITELTEVTKVTVTEFTKVTVTEFTKITVVEVTKITVSEVTKITVMEVTKITVTEVKEVARRITFINWQRENMIIVTGKSITKTVLMILDMAPFQRNRRGSEKAGERKNSKRVLKPLVPQKVL